MVTAWSQAVTSGMKYMKGQQDFLLSEINQSLKDKYCRIPLERSRVVKFVETEGRAGKGGIWGVL